jgi:transposase-like protein
MIVIACQHETRHKHGKNKCGNQRYKCATCGATFVADDGPLGTMRLSLKEATARWACCLRG